MSLVKDRIVIGLLALSAVGVYLADVYLTPDLLLPSAAYAVPIFIAAWAFPPRQVAVISIWASLLEIAAALPHQAPWWLFAIYMMGIAFFGVLGTALSYRFRREAALAQEASNRADENARLHQQAQFERARWQATVEGMLDPVTLCDAQGRVTYINPAYSSRIGYIVPPNLPLEEHSHYYRLYQSDGSLFHPEDLPLQRAALRDEEVREVEVVERTADGREFIAVFNASPLRDADGKVIGAVAVGRDITERRRAEAERVRLVEALEDRTERLYLQNEELQSQAEELASQNEELLAQRAELLRLAQERATIVESIADAVFVCDERGVLTLANSAGLRLIGEAGPGSAHTLATYRGAMQLRFPDGRPVPLDDLAISRAIRGETVVGREETGVHPVSGRRIDLLISAAPLRDQSGRVVGAVEVAADVSKLREVEEERERLIATLAESNRRLVEANRHCADMAQMAERRAAELQSVLDNMADGVLVADTEGRVTMANEAALKIFGLDPQQVLGKSVPDLGESLLVRTPDAQLRHKRNLPLARALAGETVTLEDSILRNTRTGKDVYVRTNAAPMRDEQGRIVGAVAVSGDVTQLVDLDHMKEQLIAVAAHELKTPVTIMKGFAQLLARRSEDLSPERRKILDSIDRGANRIDSVVQELLDVSLLTTGGFHLALERVDLAELVEQAVDRMALTSPTHHLQLGRADPVSVQADRRRLDHVLENLLDNAVRYSPSGGAVEVEVRVETDRAVVAVKDHGIGIPARKQARIFERLYRAHTGTPHDRGGMGVGLYLSRQIILRHGGQMDFESAEGAGSTFRFNLPLGERDGTG